MSWMRLTRFVGRMVRARPVTIAARRPLASITFDDFPQSAWRVAGPLLARHGARATYYTAGGFCGRTVGGTVFYNEDDLGALSAAGHEIACHGFGHQPTPHLATPALAEDMTRNARFLAPFLKGRTLESYAYPYGAVSVRTKRFYANRFTNIRGVHPGVNDGAVDLAQLNAVSLERRSWNAGFIDQAIARALRQNSWICFYTHGVCDDPNEYDSTPAMLESVLEKLVAAGIGILPMREAVQEALA